MYLSIQNPLPMKDTNWGDAEKIKAANPSGDRPMMQVEQDLYEVSHADVGGWLAARLWWMLERLGHEGLVATPQVEPAVVGLS